MQPRHLNTPEQHTELNGHYARLMMLRKKAKAGELPPEGRIDVFRIEESCRALGLEPGSTQWAPPTEPAPPTEVAVRMAA